MNATISQLNLAPAVITQKQRNLEVVHGLEPRQVYENFVDWCAIPCIAHKEEPARVYLRAYADKHNFPYKQDNVGNMAIYIPGRGRGINSAPVTWQFHTDMVFKPKNHDFETAPLQLVREVRKIKGVDVELISTGGTTTLGADNRLGASLAMALAIDDTIEDRPPMILLATVAEEIGLVGAKELDPRLLGDSKIMINIDNEKLGEIINACAGQATYNIDLPIHREKPADGAVPITISLENLPGGHSGIDIHEPRGNALKDLLKLFSGYLRNNQDTSLRLASISGGDARNAIASTASILVWGLPKDCARLEEYFNTSALQIAFSATIPEEFKDDVGEPRLQADMLRPSLLAAHLQHPLEAISAKSLLEFLLAVPHGVAEWDGDAAIGRPALSNNFALIETYTNELRLTCMSRHVKGQVAKDYLEKSISISSRLSGQRVNVEPFSQSNGWIGGDNYALLNKAKEVYQRVLGREPQVASMHAGVECGVIAEKCPGLETICIGATNHRLHSEKEGFEIAGVPLFYQTLRELLVELC